ncbi:glycosyltransferase family 2 protein [Jejuia pallidilutea]|jgi:teichuronic acid biosynthesis glycosyltransferase TuaG|uniref:Putative N-acetylgalactosaminyl-diphosphoundecaprenol glucuronosyltransferase n=1 Tax=Jejuia pallidilutea TaxID=504487 RepID=A0A090VZI3_9FLAO|nr:glycosyltransferase family 2 protein [Jejuia pallidilutea]GAL65294.1 putative N-acetylgalactosaminyl-diphosphoundecaprenol glucuronosyltransferase [Jejuia pallidilutea]GAL69353.1 putative N-acetylgalactosaminyl-diphosphoundecaprenol glucuronosyltransferase [Jejuia pallidilutea]GAL89122.1 putative N-acetylgalactosaminyl-diphosphoundecaprenol glucuronosyltransferase [Jejuia pallidilutea]
MVEHLVSIITPVYNVENQILQCVNSVNQQTYKNWEHILVDDFSQDNTIETLKNLASKDKRIKVISLGKNSGAGFARNIGIKNANGRYIAFLDSDDYWANNKLEKQIAFMQLNNYPFTYSRYFEFDNESGDLITLVKAPPKVTYKMLLINGGYIGCLTVVYDTVFFGKKYMPEIRKRQDWALWLKMLKDIDCAYGVMEPLAFYRMGNTSLSKSKIKLVKYNFMVYKRELNMSYLESIYRMALFLIFHFFFKSHLKEKLKN